MSDRSLDLLTVLQVTGGTVVGGTVAVALDGPGAAVQAGRLVPGAPAEVSVSRLCTPSALVAGRTGRGDVAVLASQAEVDAFTTAVAKDALPLPGVVVVGTAIDPSTLPAAVVTVQVADARLALARLAERFDGRPPPALATHASAVIERGARVAPGSAIGAGAVIAEGAVVGAGTAIGANSVVGRGSRLGERCTIHANVTIYDGVSIGDRVIIHSGAVIGADGFGYAASPAGAVKIRHAGGVVLHDDVEIGANTAVDRGTIDDTIVGARTKIDNLCQIGHNVIIGHDCLVAGTAAVGGSVVIGNGVIIGGNVAIADHVTIGNGVRVAGRSGVTKDIPDGETWAGFPARQYRHYVRSLYLGDRLEQMWEYVRKRSKADEG